jgi:hypothetical protein
MNHHTNQTGTSLHRRIEDGHMDQLRHFSALVHAVGDLIPTAGFYLLEGEPNQGRGEQTVWERRCIIIMRM